MPELENNLKQRVSIGFAVSYSDYRRLIKLAAEAGKSLPSFIRETLKCDDIKSNKN